MYIIAAYLLSCELHKSFLQMLFSFHPFEQEDLLFYSAQTLNQRGFTSKRVVMALTSNKNYNADDSQHILYDLQD